MKIEDGMIVKCSVKPFLHPNHNHHHRIDDHPPEKFSYISLSLSLLVPPLDCCITLKQSVKLLPDLNRPL